MCGLRVHLQGQVRRPTSRSSDQGQRHKSRNAFEGEVVCLRLNGNLVFVSNLAPSLVLAQLPSPSLIRQCLQPTFVTSTVVAIATIVVYSTAANHISLVAVAGHNNVQL